VRQLSAETAELATAAVSTAELATGAVSTAELATAAVSTAALLLLLHSRCLAVTTRMQFDFGDGKMHD